jgi:hypothetical protein
MKPAPTLKLSLVILAMILLPAAASADLLGTLDTGSGGSMMISLTFVRFTTDPSSAPPGPPWNGEVSTATTLTFAGCPAGILGTVGCLDAAPNGPNEGVEINHNLDLTASTVLPEDGFLLFSGNGTSHVTIDYTLTQVLAGSSNTNCAGLATGQSCSVFAGSPLVLTLDATGGTSLTLSLEGTVSDGFGPANPWTGKFSSTIPNEAPAAIQTAILGGATVATSNTGTFSASPSVSSVPEPSSVILLVGALGFLIRKMHRKFFFR